jgi:hypothetical protein
MRRFIAIAVLGVLVFALQAPSYAARRYENFQLRFTVANSFSECGIAVTSTLNARLHVITKPVRGSGGQANLGMENFRSTEVVTNPENHRWLQIDAAGTSKEIRATHISGNIWAFDLQQTGALFTMRDSDGRIVLRDRGRLRLRGTFDTLGDGRPGGVLLAEEFIGTNGKFASADEEAFCAAWTRLLG